MSQGRAARQWGVEQWRHHLRRKRRLAAVVVEGDRDAAPAHGRAVTQPAAPHAEIETRCPR